MLLLQACTAAVAVPVVRPTHEVLLCEDYCFFFKGVAAASRTLLQVQLVGKCRKEEECRRGGTAAAEWLRRQSLLFQSPFFLRCCSCVSAEQSVSLFIHGRSTEEKNIQRRVEEMLEKISQDAIGEKTLYRKA